MLNTRWHKVLRDLWSNKTRTTLVVLSIAVGVFAVGMIASTQMILVRDLSEYYLQTNPPHAILYGNFDEETVETVRRMEEVEEAEGRGRVSAQLQVGLDDWRDLRFNTVRDYTDIRVRQIYRVSGAWPPDDRRWSE